MTRMREIEDAEIYLQIALQSCDLMDEDLKVKTRWQNICFMNDPAPYIHNAQDKISAALRRLKKIEERIQYLERQ